MDKADLKQAISYICMPDDMEQRLRSYLKRAASERCIASKRYHKPLVVAVVFALCVLTVGAAATCTYLFFNPTILKNHDELNAIIEDDRTTVNGEREAAMYRKPASGTTFSMEKMIDDYTFKSNGWTSPDTINGSFRFHDVWCMMKVTDADGPLRARSVYSETGAIKEEFTAENPALLQDRLDGDLKIDFAKMNTKFSYVPDANLLYTITDSNGAYAGMFCDALYTGLTENSYFTIDYTYETDADNQSYGAPYITESDYDEAYTYTNTHGVEFVIASYGDCIWADCTTSRSTFSLYGGYLSTEEVETILEYITLAEPLK